MDLSPPATAGELAALEARIDGWLRAEASENEHEQLHSHHEHMHPDQLLEHADPRHRET